MASHPPPSCFGRHRSTIGPPPYRRGNRGASNQASPIWRPRRQGRRNGHDACLVLDREAGGITVRYEDRLRALGTYADESEWRTLRLFEVADRVFLQGRSPSDG